MPSSSKRRRPTKHRGNAAGMIESRGRTGRKPTAQERSGTSATRKKTAKVNRLDTPPTWRGSLNRAIVAAFIVLGISTLLLRMPVASMAALLPIVLLIYVPLGYYTDLFVYRRRQRRKVGGT
jgi:hypothetical protein